METNLINWKEEEKKLGTSGMSFNKTLKVDTPYSISFQDEGNPYEDNYQGQIKQKVAFKVKVTGAGLVAQEMTWFVTKSKRRDSLYGMLATLFSKNGQAKGLVLDVVASGNMKDRRYAIRQFSELQFAKN